MRAEHVQDPGALHGLACVGAVSATLLSIVPARDGQAAESRRAAGRWAVRIDWRPRATHVRRREVNVAVVDRDLREGVQTDVLELAEVAVMIPIESKVR